jgi:hypothetical protein
MLGRVLCFLAQLSRFAPDFRDIRLFSADKPLISLMCDAA